MGCGACAGLCPSGALRLEEDHNGSELLWTPAHCSRCNLCRDVCSKEALHFTPCLALEKIINETRTRPISQVKHCPLRKMRRPTGCKFPGRPQNAPSVHTESTRERGRPVPKHALQRPLSLAIWMIPRARFGKNFGSPDSCWQRREPTQRSLTLRHGMCSSHRSRECLNCDRPAVLRLPKIVVIAASLTTMQGGCCPYTAFR